MDNTTATESAGDAIPTARLEPAPSVGSVAAKIVSRLWIGTALCLLVALGLVWAEVRAKGTLVEIVFSEGHGLEAGDPVRFRGIDIGEVKSITLDDTLAHIRVMVLLKPGSNQVAREGTRFWVERPDIRVGQVRGLETLVRGQYVGVLPGPAHAPQAISFEGLATAPASAHGEYEGLEIVLESSQRLGLERGSPVSYRGVQVGHVASVGLANDSADVIARILVQPQYRSLVRENTRFWSTSGFDFRFGLGGLELNAETLATIAAGGVALATPSSPGRRVTTGHRFQLFKSADEDWLKWQPRIAIGSATLPDNAQTPRPVLGVRRSQGMSLFGRSQRRGWLLPLDNGRMLGPADLLEVSEEDKWTLEAWGEELSLGPDEVVTEGAISARDIPESVEDVENPWPVEQIRMVDRPEAVVVTCGSDDLTMPLASERLQLAEQGWLIDASVPIDESWHGASVVAAQDGLLIGLLVYSEDEGMRILPFGSKLWEAAASKPTADN